MANSPPGSRRSSRHLPARRTTGLAAVAIAAQPDAKASIDLSWQPVTDADLACYIVYRREAGATNQAWQRISPRSRWSARFHDTGVQPGHTYNTLSYPSVNPAIKVSAQPRPKRQCPPLTVRRMRNSHEILRFQLDNQIHYGAVEVRDSEPWIVT